MSVSLPERGWHAALDIKYPVAIQENAVPDLKDDVMVPDSVATIVLSAENE